MGGVTQVPIYEDVCIKTEQRLVGYRDLTSGELALEEKFSSGVPSTFGVEYALDYYIPALVVPGAYVPPRPHYPLDPPMPTPIPGALLLFGTVFAMYAIFKWTRRA